MSGGQIDRNIDLQCICRLLRLQSFKVPCKTTTDSVEWNIRFVTIIKRFYWIHLHVKQERFHLDSAAVEHEWDKNSATIHERSNQHLPTGNTADKHKLANVIGEMRNVPAPFFQHPLTMAEAGRMTNTFYAIASTVRIDLSAARSIDVKPWPKTTAKTHTVCLQQPSVRLGIAYGRSSVILNWKF